MSYRDELQAARAKIVALEEENSDIARENEHLKNDSALAKLEHQYALALTIKQETITTTDSQLFFKAELEGTLSEERHGTLFKLLENEFGEGELDSASGLFRFKKDDFQIELTNYKALEELTITDKRVSDSIRGLVATILALALPALLLILTGVPEKIFFGMGLVAAGLCATIPGKLRAHDKRPKRFEKRTQRVLALVAGEIERDKT